MTALAWIIVALLTIRECFILAPSTEPVAELVFIFIWGVGLFLLNSQLQTSKHSWSPYFKRVAAPLSVLAGLYNPGLLPALGLVVLNYEEKEDYLYLLSLLLFPLYRELNFAHTLSFLLYLGVVIYITLLDRSLLALRGKHLQALDNYESDYRRLEQDRRRLLKEQELGLESEVLSERNRIAREIHDNVGHRLTTAILQLSVLELMQDVGNKEMLGEVKANLQEAMEDIRKSVHGLHEEAMNIEVALANLAKHYSFCPVYLDLKISTPLNSPTYYAFLAICREALANTAKHSNASRVDISLHEARQQYQLLIRDNGQVKDLDLLTSRDGIGLYNMEERVSRLGGEIFFSQNQGFRIFIKVPKLEVKDAPNNR